MRLKGRGVWVPAALHISNIFKICRFESCDYDVISSNNFIPYGKFLMDNFFVELIIPENISQKDR